MPIDFSTIIFNSLLLIVALIACAIMVAYLAIVVPLTLSAWLMNAIDSKKGAALSASCFFIFVELILVLFYFYNNLQ